MGHHSSKPLKKKQLKMFKRLTNLNNDEIYAFYEEFNNSAIDGKLDFEASLSLVSIFIPGKNSAEFNKILFESFDQDKNGYLDLKELLIGISLFKSMKQIDDFVHFLFELTDRDHNRGIDRNELKPLVNWLLYFIGENDYVDTKRSKNTEIFKMQLEIDSLKQEINELKMAISNMNLYSSVLPFYKKVEKKYEKVNEIVNYAFDEYDYNRKGYLNEVELLEFMKDFFYGFS